MLRHIPDARDGPHHKQVTPWCQLGEPHLWGSEQNQAQANGSSLGTWVRANSHYNRTTCIVTRAYSLCQCPLVCTARIMALLL